MERDEALALLDRLEHGVLCMADGEGSPYGVAVNHVLRGGALYFHCAVEGHKLANIRANPRVCFTAVGQARILASQLSTAYESVVAFGRAVVVDDDGEKRDALRALVRKFSPQYAAEGEACIARDLAKTSVVRIDLDEVTGKRRR